MSNREALDSLESINNRIKASQESISIEIEKYREEHQDQVSPELVELTKSWLDDDGINFFRDLYRDYGNLSPVIYKSDELIPHSVHFNEGMQVRNMLRETGLCLGWDSDAFDNLWEVIVMAAVSPLPEYMLSDKSRDAMKELAEQAQDMGFYDSPFIDEPNPMIKQHHPVMSTEQYEISFDELDILREDLGIIPSDEDIEYFYKKLGKMASSSDAARAKVIAQISLLEDAVVVYHLSHPARLPTPRVKLNLLSDRFKKDDQEEKGIFPSNALDRHN